MCEEGEIHCDAQTYEEVIIKMQGNFLGKIYDEEKY
jgi:hypothetical protein